MNNNPNNNPANKDALIADFLKLSAGTTFSLADNVRKYLNFNDPSRYIKLLPTGYNELDQSLGGGLPPGLTYLGGAPGLGKTAFALSVGYHLAISGNPVLFFSLEMDADALAARAISSQTFVLAGKDEHLAKTTTEFTTEGCDQTFTDEDWQIYKGAIDTISAAIGNNFDMIRKDGGFDVEYLIKYVEGYIACYGKKPVIIVDYLQLLRAPKDLATDERLAIDHNIQRLVELSHKYRLTIIMVSSMNRNSYSKGIGMEALKGSGLIDYSADLVLGLQLKGAGTPALKDNYAVNAAMSTYPREVELVILKNRGNPCGNTISCKFYNAYLYFEEVGVVGGSVPGKTNSAPSVTPISKDKTPTQKSERDLPDAKETKPADTPAPKKASKPSKKTTAKGPEEQPSYPVLKYFYGGK